MSCDRRSRVYDAGSDKMIAVLLGQKKQSAAAFVVELKHP